MAKDKKTVKSKADEMLKYTSRDIGQEFIMRKKMLAAIFALIVALIALTVFIALYIDAKAEVQRRYQAQYHKCIETTIADIESYINADGDHEFRYRRIVADMSSVASFSFLLESREEQKKTINEFYTIFLKYPDQMKTKLEEAKKSLEDIYANLDLGYEEADTLIASIDLKGY